MLEEAGVHPGVPHDQRVAVQQALGRHGRGDDVLGGVGDIEEIDAGLDADLVEHRDQRLDRSIACACAEAPDTAIDLLGSGPHRLLRIGNPESEIFMSVESDLSVITEFGDQCRDSISDVGEHQSAG